MKTLHESILGKQNLSNVTDVAKQHRLVQNTFAKFLKSLHADMSDVDDDTKFSSRQIPTRKYIYVKNKNNTLEGIKQLAGKLLKVLTPVSIETPEITASWKSKVYDNRAWIAIGFSVYNVDGNENEYETIIYTENDTTYIEIPIEFSPNKI